MYLIHLKVHVQDVVFCIRTVDCDERQTTTLLNEEFLISQIRACLIVLTIICIFKSHLKLWTHLRCVRTQMRKQDIILCTSPTKLNNIIFKEILWFHKHSNRLLLYSLKDSDILLFILKP